MLALGCLIPVVLFIGGAVGGAMLDGQQGSIWGSVGGLVIGLAVPAIMLISLAAARRR